MARETITKASEKTWGELTPDEKLQRRFDAWRAAAGIQFASPQAKADYEARADNVVDALTLEKDSEACPCAA